MQFLTTAYEDAISDARHHINENVEHLKLMRSELPAGEYLHLYSPRISFGPRSGATTAAIEAIKAYPDTILVTYSLAMARELAKQAAGAPVQSAEDFSREAYSDQKTYLFDGVPARLDTLGRAPLKSIQIGTYPVHSVVN